MEQTELGGSEFGESPRLHDAVIVGQENFSTVTTALRRSSHHDWLLVHDHSVPPVDLDSINVPTAPGVQTRAVYDERFAQDPVGLQLIRERAVMGEDARLCSRVPFSFRVADSRYALLLPPEGAAAILIVDQPGPLTYRDRFEYLWDRSVPVGTSAGIPAAFQDRSHLN